MIVVNLEGTIVRIQEDAAFMFREIYQILTGKLPLSWQTRLFGLFQRNELPSVIDIPTGMGKTMVMAIWLIARARQKAMVPTRLIYVVDRRTVVDQATDLAVELQTMLAPLNDKDIENQKERKHQHSEMLSKMRSDLGEVNVAVSTLRGHLADNREWSKDLSKPSIVIGTVDLIGSALLFSGYRSSYKRRPLEAGLLAQDSLLILDEAHLSRPFEELICKIGEFQKGQGAPMRVIRMSATAGNAGNSNSTFTLQFDGDGNLTGDDARDKTIVKRFEAKKRLRILTLGEKEKLTDRLAREAINLANDKSLLGKRIAVFVRKPDDAKVIAHAIRAYTVESVDELEPKAKKVKHTPYSSSVELLTGTMRGLERDELLEKPVVKRFLAGEENFDSDKNKQPIFLISTSAGEVGFDANADHLCGNAGTLDSWTQRLGRVNRRGNGDATVILVKENDPDDKTEFDKACIATSKVLTDGLDVSPKGLAALKKSLSQQQIADASSPNPMIVQITDMLVDAWSMTSITESMPGRPEVGPWLRGINDELPQTTIAWRAELGLVRESSDHLAVKLLQRIFSKHSIRPHESITTYSYRVLEFLKQACKLKRRPNNLPDTRIALRLTSGKIVVQTIKDIIEAPGILNAGPTLILPATFGGRDAAGMLDAEAIPTVGTTNEPPPSLDVADHAGYEQRLDGPPRLRVLIRRTEDGEWVPSALPGGVALSDRIKLNEAYTNSKDLFDEFPKQELRVRLVQPIELNDEDEVIQSLVMLSPISNRGKCMDQLLDVHVGAVEAEAMRIADALELAENDPVRLGILFAARWHDEGKKAEIWQRFVYGPDAPDQFKGKSSKTRAPKFLAGYRHEFGSLLRIHHHDRCNTSCEPLANADAYDLALHLVSTHHGAGRPHFLPALYRDFTTNEIESMHTESIRRFARLQRKYGWWYLAWLENLLRCADALASADQDSEDDPTGSEGDNA